MTNISSNTIKTEAAVIKYKSKKKNDLVRRIISQAIIWVFLLAIIVPFYVIIITSLKDYDEATRFPFSWWPQDGFHFENYYNVLFKDVLNKGGISSILQGFINTIWISIPTVLVGLFMSAMAAFAFAKIKFPGREIAFSVLLFTMMLPGIVTMIPSYIIFTQLKWIRTPLPLMVPGMFGGVSCIFFLRQYFRGLPDELVEASKLDGLNYIKIFLKIILPLSIPALSAQGILWFLGMYNDYMGPMMYLGSGKLKTLQIALAFYQGSTGTNWPILMAGCVIALAPVLIIYAFTQKFFISGIAMSGLKA